MFRSRNPRQPWWALLLLLATPPLLAARVTLNAEQQAWLRQHPQIVWAAERDYQPFTYLDAQQQPRGLSHDLLMLLQQRLNLPLPGTGRAAGSTAG